MLNSSCLFLLSASCEWAQELVTGCVGIMCIWLMGSLLNLNSEAALSRHGWRGALQGAKERVKEAHALGPADEPCTLFGSSEASNGYDYFSTSAEII